MSLHITFVLYNMRPAVEDQKYVRKIMEEFDKNAGRPYRQQDCGQMSAWYVLSWRIYPVVWYRTDIGSPIFEEVKFNLKRIVRESGTSR